MHAQCTDQLLRLALVVKHCTTRRLHMPTRPPPQCLQYKSDQQIDLKKLEALNNLMLLGMAHGPDAAAGAWLCATHAWIKVI